MDSVPTPEKITAYAAYLKSQGVPDEKIQGYTKYLADQHDVDHPADNNPGWLSSVADVAESVGEGVVGAVGAVGNFMNKYSGAPTRAAISAAQNTENPISAFAKQFGEDPSKAPTGHDIAVKAGIPDVRTTMTAEEVKRSGVVPGINGKYAPQTSPSPADVVGVATDVAGDLTNVVPAYGVAKGILRAVKPGLEAAAGGVKAAAETVPVAKSIIAAGKDTGESVGKVFSEFFHPKQAADYETLKDIAVKNGIDPKILPESVEFGENSVPSRIARKVREGSTGAAEMAKWDESVKQVQGALTNKIKQISGGVAPPDPIAAGDILREGYNGAVDRLFNQVDFTHNQIIDSVPGLGIDKTSMKAIDSKLEGLEKWAKGRVERGITASDKAQGQQVMNAVEAVRAGNGTYKQMYEALSDIGRHAFKQAKMAQSEVPVDLEKFKDLYFTMRDSMVGTVERKLGKDIATGLEEGNKLISDFNNDAKQVKDVLQNEKVAPENVFKRLVQNGDSNKINVLKGMLLPEEMAQLKGAFIEELVGRHPNGMVRSFKELHSGLQNKEAITKSLFTPEEIADLGGLTQLGDRYGQMVLSTSGTGASNEFSNMLSSIKSGFANRTTLERMKDSARAAANAPKEIAPVAEESKSIALNPTATSVDKNAKVAQTVSNVQEAVKRGPDKWSTEGQSKLMSHSDEAKQILESSKDFLNTPQGKKLLMKASDLTPGSKAMDDILKRIKSRSK